MLDFGLGQARKKNWRLGRIRSGAKKWAILDLGKTSKKQKGWDLGREESLNLGKEVRLEVEWPR